MKTTKILGIAVAAVAALSFASCKNANVGVGTSGESGQNSYITKPVKDASIHAELVATCDYTNKTNEYARTMRLFDTNKKGITANLKIENKNDNPGAVSIVFDFFKNNDGTYNFGLVGFKYDNCIKAYCTFYPNVKEEDFEKQNFGKSEEDIIDLTPYFKYTSNEVSNPKLDEKKFLVADQITGGSMVVEVEAMSDATNAYTIRLYPTPEGGDLEKFNMLSNKTDKEKKELNETSKYVLTITKEQIAAKKAGKVENKMGFYANTYANKTLKAAWQVADMSH
ncbi:hypothetical protein [Treponema sp.]|uniref:hypothetical protein n=1 Tax=Treponema sp. TaxID=166 RepID=UPI00298EB473|nr:hypothetical protein [Treponema sp.]